MRCLDPDRQGECAAGNCGGVRLSAGYEQQRAAAGARRNGKGQRRPRGAQARLPGYLDRQHLHDAHGPKTESQRQGAEHRNAGRRARACRAGMLDERQGRAGEQQTHARGHCQWPGFGCEFQQCLLPALARVPIEAATIGARRRAAHREDSCSRRGKIL